jgi:hypothetical protein
MTSEEIKAYMSPKDPRKELPLTNGETDFWLAEIAYQLAVGNEQRHPNALEMERFKKNHGLAGPVCADSETEVREEIVDALKILTNALDPNTDPDPRGSDALLLIARYALLRAEQQWPS